METKLLAEKPLGGQYPCPWTSLGELPGLDDWTIEYNSRPPKTWILCSPNHPTKNIASSLPCLGWRIINRENRWNDTFNFYGVFLYIPRYWGWAEDILSRGRQTLKDLKIYNVMYAHVLLMIVTLTICKTFAKLYHLETCT